MTSDGLVRVPGLTSTSMEYGEVVWKKNKKEKIMTIPDHELVRSYVGFSSAVGCGKEAI